MDNLKELRIKMGMTQTEVAVKVGVSLTAYQTWERRVGKPNAQNMGKLKEVLKIK